MTTITYRHSFKGLAFLDASDSDTLKTFQSFLVHLPDALEEETNFTLDYFIQQLHNATSLTQLKRQQTFRGLA